MEQKEHEEKKSFLGKHWKKIVAIAGGGAICYGCIKFGLAQLEARALTEGENINLREQNKAQEKIIQNLTYHLGKKAGTVIMKKK
jgi:hypothetical protein